MKPIFASAGPLSALLLAALLSGCAADQGARHRQHHPDTGAGHGHGPMMGGGHGGDGHEHGRHEGGRMGMMNMQAMCDRYEKMRNAPSPEERRALMDEHMKSMSPEMMQRHLDMMQARCKRA